MAEDVELIREKAVTVIRIHGKFNYQIQMAFRVAMEEAAKEDPTRPLSVNLAGVEYMDSAALGMLFLLRDRVGETRPVRIVHAGPAVLNILKAAFVQDVFEIPQLQ